jgi:hypothetical protein
MPQPVVPYCDVRHGAACDHPTEGWVTQGAAPAHLLQDFLKVFDQLRDEIVNDELLGAQPDFAKKWMEEVGGLAAGLC